MGMPASAAKEWTAEMWEEFWKPSDERPEILETTIEWRPSGEPASLIIDLPQLFKQALDE
jgi:hypothetical protein